MSWGQRYEQAGVTAVAAWSCLNTALSSPNRYGGDNSQVLEKSESLWYNVEERTRSISCGWDREEREKKEYGRDTNKRP